MATIALLFGGSIGPEGPLTGEEHGGLGCWVAERLKLSRPAVAIGTYSGFSGMFGAFLGISIRFPVDHHGIGDGEREVDDSGRY